MPGKTGAEKGARNERSITLILTVCCMVSITRLRNVSDERMTGRKLTSLQKRQLKACYFCRCYFGGVSKPRERC